LSYSRDDSSPATTIPKAQGKTQALAPSSGARAQWCSLCGGYPRSNRRCWLKKIRLMVTAVPALCK